jgi:hypothetical protein
MQEMMESQQFASEVAAIKGRNFFLIKTYCLSSDLTKWKF